MNKEILEEIKKILVNQQEKNNEIMSNTENIYEIIWSYFIELLAEDKYGFNENYVLKVCYKKDNKIINNIRIYNLMNSYDEYSSIVSENILFEMLKEDEFIFENINSDSNYNQINMILNKNKILDYFPKSNSKEVSK